MTATEVRPDPKPRKRKRLNGRQYVLLRECVRRQFPGCPVCGLRGESAHHVVPRIQGGDDVPENIVIPCGDGTTGCHGDIEARRNKARERLREYLELIRPDVIRYVKDRKGEAWLDRNYPRRA